MRSAKVIYDTVQTDGDVYSQNSVFDEVPNDIRVVSGFVTQEPLTPLWHLNVLSRTRKPPNMGLRNALTTPTLLANGDRLIELTVAAPDGPIHPATQEEGEAQWASHGVNHKTVVMALLVHELLSNEEADGVAVTSNIFDITGVDPVCYINVQHGGDAEGVHPPQNVTADQMLTFYSQPNQPISCLAHSNLIPVGTAALSKSQLHTLGSVLAAIHNRSSAACGPANGNNGWYAMGVESAFDNDEFPAELAKLDLKQARPYPEP